MTNNHEDYGLGANALLGRAIGEVNGLQRRVDTLEREIFILQEKIERKPSRFDFAVFIIALLMLAGILGGAGVAVNLWWAGKLHLGT